MIDNVPVNLLGNAIDFHRVRFINSIEQRRKCITKIKAATTAMTDVKNTLKLLVKRLFGVEFIGLPVQGMPGRRLQTALASCARQAT